MQKYLSFFKQVN